MPWRDAFLYEYNYERQFPFTPNVRAMRIERWKLIHDPRGNEASEQYTRKICDLHSDPFEMVNLVQRPEHAHQRTSLEKRLEELSQTAGPDFLPFDEGIFDVPSHF